MPGTVLVGLQFGDEGKGKFVDYLAERSDVVVRFNGGANAGHTVIVGGERFAFRLLPSGIIRPGVLNVIGNGVVIDPQQLLLEVDELRKRGHAVENLRVSDRAHVVMPWHKALDELEEGAKGGLAAGSTRRGIGPAFQDKVGRWGVRVADLLDESILRKKLETVVPVKQKVIRAMGGDSTFALEAVFRNYVGYGERMAPYVVDTGVLLAEALAKGRRVLFEGAQGTHLCVDHGLYPYGTSSNTVAGQALVGAGVGPGAIQRVVGVAKAFTSRVGAGPFPTEIEGADAEYLRKRGGGEYGTVTGRPRRIGWLDLVMVRTSARVNGLTDLAVTKLDVLGGLATVRAAVAYEFDGGEVLDFPANLRVLRRSVPKYREFDGWEDLPPSEWRRIASKGYAALPRATRGYLDWIAGELGVALAWASVGQGREDTIAVTKAKTARPRTRRSGPKTRTRRKKG